MTNIKKLFSALFICSVLSVSFIYADKTPVENLYQYNLDNGLTLFAVENHTVPLVYIEIAVKAGAVAQTPETAGLFHLYEHMMFKGNALYPDAASVQKALNDLGVTSWNGTTGTDCVNYFFTIPSDQLESGLAFWNAAIRSPLMDSSELEVEKDVVLSEIEGDAKEQSQIYYDYVSKTLFPDAPYRVDAGGSFTVVKNATVAQLRDMQSKYYIPENAALFVGGDIDPEETYELVKKIYGTWSNNGNSVPAKAPQQNTNPLNDVEYLVMPFDQMSDAYCSVSIDFRGPDTDYEIEDTYSADYLLNLLGDPEGTFCQTLYNNEALCIPDVDYVYGSYGTQRASGNFSFGGYLLNPEDDIVNRVNLFMSEIQDNILPAMANDKSLYSKKKVSQIAQSLKDNDILSSETATGLLSDLRFWWACSNPEYYYTYNQKLQNVKQSDIASFVNKYFTGKKPVVSVLINPEIYEEVKDSFAEAGYKEIKAEDAFWYNDSRYAPDSSKIALETSVPESSEIYKPSGNTLQKKENNENEIKTVTLKNGIPVYIQEKETNRVDSIYIGVKGGVEHLTPETSGLEAALFSMMGTSSKKYSKDYRDSLSFVKPGSIGNSSFMSGSVLGLNAIDYYFYDWLPVLLDGFINPSYDEDDFENLVNDLNQGIQSMLNDGESLLAYKAYTEIYKGHPYETRSSVTPDSVSNITIDNLKALYSKIINPSEIFVVAVGNIDCNKLTKELNKTLGKIKQGNSEKYVPKEVPPVVLKDLTRVLTHQSVKDSGYIARVFASPANTSADYPYAVLASDIYSDLMYNVVRERYGATYSAYSFCTGSKAPTGEEYLYKIKGGKYGDVVSYLNEARSYMEKGLVITSVENNNYVTEPLSECLESYKNKYINSTYEGKTTNNSVAGDLAYNVLQFDDINHDKQTLQKIKDATYEQVMEAFNKYWINAPCQWWAVVGPGDEGELKF